MTHYFSLAFEGGRFCTTFAKIPLEWAFAELWTRQDCLATEKGNGRLMAMGYPEIKNEDETYSRKESAFKYTSTIMIDCDNLSHNQNILNEFNDFISQYEHWTWESASSNTDRCPYPKFRAVIPLDHEISWSKHTKKAIGMLFPDFVDEGASWFEEPLLDKSNTITHHEGKLFPSALLEQYINMLERDEQRKLEAIEQANERRKQWMVEHPDEQRKLDPRKLPCVKKYLEGSWGEGTDRRPRAHAAIYGMLAHDVPQEEIREIILSGPAAQFKRFLQDSINSCARALGKARFTI